MKTTFDITIIHKDNAEKTIIKKNCSEYGTSNGGTVFYYVEKKDIEDMDIIERIEFINMEKIDHIEIIRKNRFETKKEKLEFIKSGGLSN